MDFPRITIIMRGYSYEEVDNVAKAITNIGGEKDFAFEITENTPHVFDIIQRITTDYPNILTGAGTILNLQSAKKAIESGAKFILSPIKLEKEIIDYCKQNNIITVPAAFSPSEVVEMSNAGADIIKIFPATILGPEFFKAIQGPLGNLKLMAVGGISSENIEQFKQNKVSYFGIGSSMFKDSSVKEGNIEKIEKTLLETLKI